MVDVSTPPPSGTQAPRAHRYSRAEAASLLDRFEAQGVHVPQRQRAAEAGVPRSTALSWQQRREGIDAPPAVVSFLESADGQTFVKRLLFAVVLTMLTGPHGLRGIVQILRLSHLDRFFAASLGSVDAFVAQFVGHIETFGQDEQARLSAQCTDKRPIVLVPDEVFRPGVHLVAVDAISGYCFVTEESVTRSEQAWRGAFARALANVNVEPISAVGDEGKGLTAAVENGLGVAKYADLLHGQLELTRAASAMLTACVNRCQKALEKAKGGLAEEVARLQASLNEAEVHRQTWTDVVRGMSSVLHPYDLATGKARSEPLVEQELNALLTKARGLSETAKLPERVDKAISKVEKLVPNMALQVSFYHTYCAQAVGALALGGPLTVLVHKVLLPALYLRLVAARAPKAARRHELWATAEQWLQALQSPTSPWQATTAAEQAAILAVCESCVKVFQRTSAAVEGRNGKLSLFAMLWHQLPPERLRALTVVHNFWTKRADGTTAAERLFGAPPKDLFEYLLAHVELPPRPRSGPTRTCTDVPLN